MKTPSKCPPDHPSPDPSTCASYLNAVIGVTKVIHHFVYVCSVTYSAIVVASELQQPT